MHAHLGDGHAMQGAVQLSVATAVQAVAVAAAAGDRHGGDAGVHGEAGLAARSAGAGRLAEQASGGEAAEPGRASSSGASASARAPDLALQGVDLARERRDSGR